MTNDNDAGASQAANLAKFRANLMQLPQGAEIGHSEVLRRSLSQSTESWSAFVEGLIQEFAIRIDSNDIIYASAPSLSSVIDLALESCSQLHVRLSDVKAAFAANLRIAISCACEHESDDRAELLARVRVKLMELLKDAWSSSQWFDMGRHLALKIAAAAGNPVIDTQMQIILANCLVMSDDGPMFDIDAMRDIMSLRIRLLDAIIERDAPLAIAIYDRIELKFLEQECSARLISTI